MHVTLKARIAQDYSHHCSSPCTWCLMGCAVRSGSNGSLGATLPVSGLHGEFPSGCQEA
jgi:hypothetical protein